MSDERFWMLYRAGGRSPNFKHGSADSARAEARRIAHESGGRVFVLEAVEVIEFTSTALRPGAGDDAAPVADGSPVQVDDIPF